MILTTNERLEGEEILKNNTLDNATTWHPYFHEDGQNSIVLSSSWSCNLTRMLNEDSATHFVVEGVTPKPSPGKPPSSSYRTNLQCDDQLLPTQALLMHIQRLLHGLDASIDLLNGWAWYEGLVGQRPF